MNPVLLSSRSPLAAADSPDHAIAFGRMIIAEFHLNILDAKKHITISEDLDR